MHVPSPVAFVMVHAQSSPHIREASEQRQATTEHISVQMQSIGSQQCACTVLRCVFNCSCALQMPTEHVQCVIGRLQCMPGPLLRNQTCMFASEVGLQCHMHFPNTRKHLNMHRLLMGISLHMLVPPGRPECAHANPISVCNGTSMFYVSGRLQ